MNISFTEYENKKIRKFAKKHKKCDENKLNRGDSKYIYILIPGPIGWGIDVKCNVCKKLKDITDYSVW